MTRAMGKRRTSTRYLAFLIPVGAVLAALREEGCDVDDRTETSELGRFGWVMDPDGNRVELWEPA